MPGVGTFTTNPRDLVGEREYGMIDMYRQCDQGLAGMRYPDGRALLDQPCVMLSAFGVIAKALHDFDPANADQG